MVSALHLLVTFSVYPVEVSVTSVSGLAAVVSVWLLGAWFLVALVEVLPVVAIVCDALTSGLELV